MKTIEIEGIRLTEEIIERIEYFQMDEGKGLYDYLRLIDRIIRHIALNANENMCDLGKVEALGLIGELSQFRYILSCFSGKESEE